MRNRSSMRSSVRPPCPSRMCMSRDDRRRAMLPSQGARDGGDRQTNTLVTVDAGPYALRFLRFLRTRGRRPPDETLLERRPLYVAALALAGLSFVVHQPLLFV